MKRSILISIIFISLTTNSITVFSSMPCYPAPPVPSTYEEYFITESSHFAEGLEFTITLFYNNMHNIRFKNTIKGVNNKTNIIIQDDFFNVAIYDADFNLINLARVQSSGVKYSVSVYRDFILEEKWLFANQSIIEMDSFWVSGIFYVNNTIVETDPILMNNNWRSSNNLNDPVLSVKTKAGTDWLNKIQEAERLRRQFEEELEMRQWWETIQIIGYSMSMLAALYLYWDFMK